MLSWSIYSFLYYIVLLTLLLILMEKNVTENKSWSRMGVSFGNITFVYVFPGGKYELVKNTTYLLSLWGFWGNDIAQSRYVCNEVRYYKNSFEQKNVGTKYLRNHALVIRILWIHYICLRCHKQFTCTVSRSIWSFPINYDRT